MSVSAPDQIVATAASLLRSARHAVALTGAGISTPSGIPDFRSHNTGLWEHDDPMQVASLTAFRTRPQVFFNWLRPLAKSMWTAQPNPAHVALAELERAGYLKALITQNIDGLHQRAGSRTVIEVHGSMNTFTCPQCHCTYSGPDLYPVFIDRQEIPHCAHCESILKPDIVMFEEMLPRQAWHAASEHSLQADLMLVVGSALTVTPASLLPTYTLRQGGRLIINTFSPTGLDDRADLLLPYDVAEILPLIAARLL